MGMADMAVALWGRHLKHNPANPQWFDRDRFVLSNGHASMLLYALLHLTGYDLPLQELKNFRQLGSKTAGHPEVGHTPGVETTTGPLGQGVTNAVGMALAEKLLAAEFNRDGHAVVDHHTYTFLGDGCLMEGISHEAVALAGAFECGVNDLPLSMILSWYEQKAVVILLTLLSLGIKNIRLGPSLPAFITPNVLAFLVENFNIMPITTAEEDLKAILG